MATLEGRHRLHPLSALVRGWKVVVAFLAFAAQQGIERAGRGLDARHLLVLAGAGVTLSLLYGWASWVVTRYSVQDGHLRVDTGVLFRSSRRVRLDRLQAIDVLRPVLARALGLAELRLDVAGGRGSHVTLTYLSDSEALALRAELLALAAGLDADAGEAPERVLARVELGDLALAHLLCLDTLAGILAMLGLGVAAARIGGPGVVAALVSVALATLAPAARRFLSHYGFLVAESPDGLRVRHGLLETLAHTVPPGRVQAVAIVEPLLWRRLRGWCRVELNVAGHVGPGDGSQSVLLPVATRQVALDLLARALPGLDLAAIPLSAAPRRARWVDPVGQPVLAAGADERFLVTRHGRITRRTDIVAHERTQSVRLRQGWLQRRLGLATVHLASTPGPVSPRVAHRDAGEAALIVASQAERARRARASALPERWMTARPQDGGTG